MLEIVIPALNEANRLLPTLQELAQYLPSLGYPTALTVVDNGSVDGTAELARALMRPAAGDRVVSCGRRGKGAAVRAAVLSSDAQWIGFMDADLATPLRFLGPAVSALMDGHTVVIGSRRVPGARCVGYQSLPRQAGAWAFRAAVRRMVPDVADTQCGFKFFAGPTARWLFSTSRLDGFSFDVEVLGIARQSGLKIFELPVEWTARSGSTFRPLRDGSRVAAELLELRRRLPRVGKAPTAASAATQ